MACVLGDEKHRKATRGEEGGQDKDGGAKVRSQHEQRVVRSYVANIHEEDTRVYGAGTMHKGVVS